MRVGEYHEKTLATTSFDLSEGSHQVALAKLHTVLAELERIPYYKGSSKIQTGDVQSKQRISFQG